MHSARGNSVATITLTASRGRSHSPATSRCPPRARSHRTTPRRVRLATGGHVLPAAGVPLRGLAAVVGYSRVPTGVHDRGDVLAGALLGTAVAELTTRIAERISRASG